MEMINKKTVYGEIPLKSLGFVGNLPMYAEALNIKICRLIGFQSTKEVENTA